MDKLERCPHCDGAASLRSTSCVPDPHDPWTFVTVFVRCDECGAQGPAFEYCCNGDEEEPKKCKQAAIDGWNRRPTRAKTDRRDTLKDPFRVEIEVDNAKRNTYKITVSEDARLVNDENGLRIETDIREYRNCGFVLRISDSGGVVFTGGNT